MQQALKNTVEEIEVVIKKVISLDSRDLFCTAIGCRTDTENDIFLSGWFQGYVVEGNRYKVKGRLGYNLRYGETLKVTDAEAITPQNGQEIVNYLCSGFFKGIGKKTAQRIVDRFGMDTINILEVQPERLSEVKGIGPKTLSNIIESYKKGREIKDLFMELQPYGLSSKMVYKIYQEFGGQSLLEIQKNPYILCKKIKGISFELSDALGGKYQIPLNNEARLEAGIIYILEEWARNGNTFIPVTMLSQIAEKKLRVDRNEITKSIIDMRNAGEIIMDDSDGSIYLPTYYFAIMYVAKKLKLMASQKVGSLQNVENLITKMEQENNIEYAPKQKEAFRSIDKSNVMIITGGPGTGKTTIIKGIIRIIKENFPDKVINLAAPTGRAAKRMQEATGIEASTIHRLLKFQPSEDGLVCEFNEVNQLPTDVLIVDESSMIDILLMSNLLKALRPETQLIMVGDVDQLPAVGAGNVLGDMINSELFTTVRLNEIFRQSEASKIIVNASRINQGLMPVHDNKSEFFIFECKNSEIPREIVKYYKRVQDTGTEVQVLTPFRRKTACGSEELNKLLQKEFNPRIQNVPEVRYGGAVYRTGDKVMQIKNNYEKDRYNGDIGIVTKISANENGDVVTIRFEDGMEVDYSKDDLEEIRHSYAISIHKSQGCEYECVIIPMTMEHKRMLKRNLLYTGITRGKKWVILIGSRQAIEQCIKDSSVEKRFTKLEEKLKRV